MRVQHIIRTAWVPIIAMLTSALYSSAALAGPQLEDILNTCTHINCRSQLIRGVSQTTEPFVIQVYAAEGECLRMEVTSQTADVEMVLISPDIEDFIYTDDDRAGQFRPVIAVDPVTNRGWHKVLVSEYRGALERARFKLRYGRYDSGNPNCERTTPVICTAATNSDLSKPTGLYLDLSEEPDL